MQVGTEGQGFAADRQAEGTAGVPYPNLDGIDTVECRMFALRQQEVDGAGDTTGAIRGDVSPYLTVVPTLRVRLKIKRVANGAG